MRICAVQGSLVDRACDVLIVNLFEGVKYPGGGTGAVDSALGGALTELIGTEQFDGSLGNTAVAYSCGKIPAKKVLLVGLGKREDFGVQQILQAAGSAAKKCRELQAASVASILHGAGIGGLPVYDCARATALGTMLGSYEFVKYKTEVPKRTELETFEIVELTAAKLPEIERGIEMAGVVGDSITFARDLNNEPSNVVTPSYLASVAEQIAHDFGMECKVLDRKGIEEAGMNLLAAVSRGSAVEPRFIELRYNAPGAKKTVAIIGKGITFDTGGYSLKSHSSMYGMKDDMSGAGAVLAAMRAIGRLKPSVNVVGLAPATENCIGPTAIHPGDVFISLGGKSVEVNNTDAEGRLILSDAVAHARNLGVDEIIDLATLTGACVTALGYEISGIIGNNQRLIDRLIECGKLCSERMWQLPYHESYRDKIKSDVADTKNTGDRGGEAIVGALFIGNFVGDIPWAHIDLAAATVDKDVPLAKKGSTGAGTGTLIEYLLSENG